MIDWLVNQVQYLWTRLNAAFTYAYNQAVSWAQDAYNRAVSWARSAVDAARAVAQTITNGVRSLAVDLWQDARGYALQLFNSIGSLVSSGIHLAETFATQLYNSVLGWITDRVDWLRAQIATATSWIQSWVNGLIGDVIKWFAQNIGAITAIVQWFASGVAELWSWLKKLTEIFTPDNLKKITDFLGRSYAAITGFFDNPLGSIAAYVLSFFLTMLCDVLAHGLGTLKYDLPPMRTYGFPGGGGTFPVGPGPGPGSSGLSSPLSALRISGYTFGPGHPGTDFGLSMGQAVFAAHSGVVLEAGWNPSGYGFDVVLEGAPWWTRYGHLQQPLVGRGDSVKQGQPIGLGDTTGNSTGPHLHFEVKYNGKFVDPVTVL